MEAYKDEQTQNLTQDLMKCTVRLIHSGDQHVDYPVDSGKAFNGQRQNHPYIKNFLGALDSIQEQQILILNPDGSERLGPITIPAGRIPVFRIRSRFYNEEMMTKSIIIGIVNRDDQELHFLDIHGNETITSSPTDHGFTKKIELLPEELERL